MNAAELTIHKKYVALFVTVILLFAGYQSYQKMGKLEDPEFTIKTAVVSTLYPGATARQVEEEVTDTLEVAIQQLGDLDHVRSVSRPGHSLIYIDIKESRRAHEMNQIWDDLRKKISDVAQSLPPGVDTPVVRDDFGDVYGVLLALVGDGFSPAELGNYADDIRRELLSVPDVSKVNLWGKRVETVFVEMSKARMSELNIPTAVAIGALHQQNMMVNAGAGDSGRDRIRFRVAGEFRSVEEIGNLVIRGSTGDNLVVLHDIATIRRGYLEPAQEIMRFNGHPAVALAISTVQGGNVITMGQAVKRRIQELKATLPVGIELEVVSYQSDTVTTAINEFMINLGEALAIVVALLLVFMGLRSGLLIGAGLVLTILTTFLCMSWMGLNLDRVSLGALIIALGMLVDNAIVITESMDIKIQQGMKRLQAARDAVHETWWPLLGATLVAVFAFMPIYTARNNTGEYCQGLFLVVGVSLMVSWVLAITITPLSCHMFLKPPKNVVKDPYAGPLFRAYRGFLVFCLRFKFIPLLCMVGLLGASIYGFKYVDQTFFPQSTRPQFMVDYRLPEGARIQDTEADTKVLEKAVSQIDGVTSVAAFIGGGPPRFYLPMEPELPSASFGQLIVNVDTPEVLPQVLAQVETLLADGYPHAEVRARRFPLGPGSSYKLEARFRGPDIAVLHRLAAEAMDLYRADGGIKNIRHDWRQRIKVLEAEYSQGAGAHAGVSRVDVADTLKLSFDGLTVGVYREGNDLLPVIVRPPLAERGQIGDIESMEVRNNSAAKGVPLARVAPAIQLKWEESTIRRRDRQRTITVQGSPRSEAAETIRKRLIPALAQLELPPGYSLEWGGEFEKSNKSRKMVFAGVPASFMLMALVVVALFNNFRQPLIIAIILPLSLIGITAGLLITKQSFGFLSLLGALSLAGMLIKNAVVLIDQTDMNIRAGTRPYDAVLDAAVSRIRPVLMASLSTVLGMMPLVFDKFWASMAVTISFGLTFATVLTLVVVPVLYAMVFRIRP